MCRSWNVIRIRIFHDTPSVQKPDSGVFCSRLPLLIALQLIVIPVPAGPQMVEKVSSMISPLMNSKAHASEKIPNLAPVIFSDDSLVRVCIYYIAGTLPAFCTVLRTSSANVAYIFPLRHAVTLPIHEGILQKQSRCFASRDKGVVRASLSCSKLLSTFNLSFDGRVSCFCLPETTLDCCSACQMPLPPALTKIRIPFSTLRT